MPYRLIPFANQNFYHIYNRGVEKRKIFSSDRDYQRFLQTLYYYQFSGPKSRFSTYNRFRLKEFNKNPKIVEIICYCLMPNHFHLLVRQVNKNGIQEFMSKVLNSYTKYYNTKNKRVGPLFQGTFKAVNIDSDEQLLHLSRYIHLNPYVSELVKDLSDYHYSSYHEFLDATKQQICITQPILDFFPRKEDYKKFINNQQDYGITLHQIKDRLIEDD